MLHFAERELRAAGFYDDSAPYGNGELAAAVLELITVFTEQGHSGGSAPLVVEMFRKLAQFQPLTPLAGEASEWTDIGNGTWQNNRCSRVFKTCDGAYDIDGRIFREPSGLTYTSKESHVTVEFPYTPKSEIVEVSS